MYFIVEGIKGKKYHFQSGETSAVQLLADVVLF